MRSNWRARPAITPSFRTARAKRKTLSSPTWPLRRALDRSRRAPLRARIASPSTTNCCGSKKSSAPQLVFRAKQFFPEHLNMPDAGAIPDFRERFGEPADTDALVVLINVAFRPEQIAIEGDRINAERLQPFFVNGKFLV